MRITKKICKINSLKAKFCKYLFDFYFATEEVVIHYYIVGVYR